MKNKLTIFVIIFIAFVCGFLANSAQPVSARSWLHYGRFEKIADGNPCDTYKDKKTGIEYVVAETDDGIGISVVYNADGKPRVDKEDK